MSDDFIVMDVGGNGIPLTELWVWATVHSEDNVSIATLNGLPLVMQKRELALKFLAYAQQAANVTGKPMRLIRMSAPEIIDEVDPR